ncbi:5203_t:CDS:10 [Paraglomus brasilianum]|uniref:2,4-dienoyl-CoA reductase [(3E)-enoyl-CoA-producing] n=1 Tax=Paraglomus brasilianum TaxID=144538 RepID=A0A9N9D188_9GLOM|nr:5203_t:CDS:10 [Paraglomus brasilianum]
MPTTDVFKKDLLIGKIAFVTGGNDCGSGICKGMTEALLRHGAKAFIIGRSQDRLDRATEELRTKTGGQIAGIAADVRNPEQVEKAVGKAIELFGKVDILVNGAAGNFLASFENLSYRAFRTVIEIDLIGTFNVTKACLPYLKKSRGCIINVSATHHYTAMSFQSHVSAAKAGVDALSKSLALELGPLGIRVNVIAPGPIADTEGIQRLLPAADTERLIRGSPLQTLGKIQDIEYATVFLVSDAARYISGHILVVDGGTWMHQLDLLPYPECVLEPKKFNNADAQVQAVLDFLRGSITILFSVYHHEMVSKYQREYKDAKRIDKGCECAVLHRLSKAVAVGFKIALLDACIPNTG